MHLSGAGHGVSTGVEPVGTSSYIWMECDSDRTDGDGRGTALARFKFVSGGVPSVTKHLQGSSGITAATDPCGRHLVVRRKESGSMWFSVYDQAAAARGDFSSRISHVVQPYAVTRDPRTDLYIDFQGYAVYGQYAYCLAGRKHNKPSEIDSTVSCVDLRTGAVVQREITRAGLSLPNREPEGMTTRSRTRPASLRASSSRSHMTADSTSQRSRRVPSSTGSRRTTGSGAGTRWPWFTSSRTDPRSTRSTSAPREPTETSPLSSGWTERATDRRSDAIAVLGRAHARHGSATRWPEAAHLGIRERVM